MKRRLFSMALAVAATLAAANVSRAGSITFITPAGSTAGGQPVDVTATLTTSAGQVLIAVQNLENNPKSDIQTLNGISFSLSTGQTAVSSFTQEAVQPHGHKQRRWRVHRHRDSHDPYRGARQMALQRCRAWHRNYQHWQLRRPRNADRRTEWK